MSAATEGSPTKKARSEKQPPSSNSYSPFPQHYYANTPPASHYYPGHHYPPPQYGQNMNPMPHGPGFAARGPPPQVRHMSTGPSGYDPKAAPPPKYVNSGTGPSQPMNYNTYNSSNNPTAVPSRSMSTASVTSTTSANVNTTSSTSASPKANKTITCPSIGSTNSPPKPAMVLSREVTVSKQLPMPVSSSSLNYKNKDKGRGSYRCGKCGVPKKGHVCPYQPKLKRKTDQPPPQMKNAGTQVEMDEFLVVRRLNLEIQGFPESYTAAPMMDDKDRVGAEVQKPREEIDLDNDDEDSGTPDMEMKTTGTDSPTDIERSVDDTVLNGETGINIGGLEAGIGEKEQK